MTKLGDVVFQAGRGHAAFGSAAPVVGGSIVFIDADGKEALRFGPSGEVFVRDTPVDVDATIYNAFRGWLLRAKCEHTPEGFVVSL